MYTWQSRENVSQLTVHVSGYLPRNMYCSGENQIHTGHGLYVMVCGGGQLLRSCLDFIVLLSI